MNQLINKELFDILLPLCKCNKAELVKFNIQRVFFNKSDYYSIDVLIPSNMANEIPYSYKECDNKDFIMITFSCLFEFMVDYKLICDGKYSKISDVAYDVILESCIANREFWSNVFVRNINSIMTKIKEESSIQSTEVLRDLAEIYYESNLELYKPLNELRYVNRIE